MDRTTTGILMMVGFCVFAPIMDAMAKLTPHEYPIAEILAARFSVQVVLLLPVAYFMAALHIPSLRDVAHHLLRGFLLLVATAFFFAAIRHMPIANAMAIFFVEPFILTVLGAVFLKETIGPRRVAACFVGFIGAMLIIKPSFSGLGPVALYPLGTAMSFALYMVLTRSMAQKINPVTMQIYTAIAACALLLPLLW